jgi:hypothetical protein
MAQCEVCGNEYDKAFTLTVAGQSHVFDCSVREPSIRIWTI